MKKNKAIKTLLLIIVVSLLIVMALFFAAQLYFNSLYENVTIEEINEEEIHVVEIEPTETRHEVVNFMLVGADNSARDRENSYAQARSDVFKIVSLDYTDNKIKITSLDRDVVVWLPIEEEYGHFNWAYAYGGAKSSLAAINYNLDLDVEKYVGVSFAGFRDIIDYLGGVDVEVTAYEANYINTHGEGNISYLKEGINHMDGATALVFSRVRYLDSDFERMDRQNIVIKAIITKLKGLSLPELLDVTEVCLKYVTTNITASEIKSYLLDLIGFDLTDIDTHMYPSGRYDDISRSNIGGYVLKSYSDAVIEIHNFIYDDENYVPTDTIYDLEKKTYALMGEFKK